MKNQKPFNKPWHLLPCILSLCLIFQFSPVKATHMSGGDISYTILNGDMNITVTLYRDCNGIDATVPGLSYYSDCGGGGSLALTTYASYDITPTNGCSRCSNSTCSFAYGMEEYIYHAKLKLDPKCCKYTLSWAESMRGYYSNISPSSYSDMYMQAVANTCMGNYSSGSFSSPPPIFATVKQCNKVSQASYSADGLDSFVYYLSPALQAFNDPVNYQKGYSYDSPIKTATTGPCQGFNYDSRTGELQFYPTQIDRAAIVVSVDQYRPDSTGKYQYCGTVSREFAMVVQDMVTNTPPDIIYTDKDTVHACVGSKLSLIFKTKDSDNDSVSISGKRLTDFSGGTFSSSSDARQSLTFNWSPTGSDLRKAPYEIMVTAKDNKTINGITQKAVWIYVVDTFPKYSVSKSDSACGKYFFQFNGDTNAFTGYAWAVDGVKKSTQRSFTFQAPYNGNFDVSLFVTNKSGCTDQNSNNVSVSGLPQVSISKVNPICEGDSVKLYASGADDYTWEFSDGATFHSNNVYVHPQFTTTYYVIGKTTNGCQAQASVVVNLDTLHIRAGNDTSICSGKGATLTATNLPGYTYKWTPSTGLTFDNSYKVVARPSQDITYTVTATSPYGCISRDSMRVKIYVPNVNAGPDTRVCKGDSVQLHASGGSAYYWYPAGGMSTNNQVADPYVHPTSNQQYVVSIHDSLDCHVFLDTVAVKVDSVSEHISGNTSMCKGDQTELHSVGGDAHYWTPSQFFDDPHAAVVHASPEVSGWVYVTATDNTSGCSKRDSIYIHVSNNCVWPGDANYDGTANYLDLLNVGVGYGKTGHSRANATESWQQQLSTDWSQSTAEGINYKEIDANGDGMINASDTDAIVNNYGKTHSGGNALKDSTGDIPFYFAFDRDTFYAGDTVHATLNIGNQDHSVSALYGAGMQFSGSMAEVKDKSYSFSFNNSILGSNNTSLELYRAGVMNDASMVRTDQNTVSGYGSLAQISYVLKDSTYPYLSNGEWIHLHLQYARAVDNTGKPIAIQLIDDSAIVFKNRQTSGIVGALKASSFVLYPNPADQQLVIESKGLSIQKLQIANMLGQEVLSVKEPVQDKLTLDVSTLHPGIYIVEIQTNEGYARYKINIAR